MLKGLQKVGFGLINNSKKFNSFNLKLFSTFNFEVCLPSLKKMEVSIEGDKPLSAIETEIKKDDKYRTVEFRTWDNSNISKNNSVDSALKNREPVFIRLNTMEWQLLNFKSFDTIPTGNFGIKTKDAKSEINQIISHLQKFNNNKLLSTEELNQIALSLFRIKNAYSMQDANKLSTNFKNLEQIFQSFYELKYEYSKLFTLKEKLLQGCQFKARLLLILTGILFILELLFIYWGTFIKYSWDIVEPVTYLIGCLNLIAILFFKRKMGKLSPLEYYTQKYFKRIVNKKKFNEAHFKEISRKLKEIENILNK